MDEQADNEKSRGYLDVRDPMSIYDSIGEAHMEAAQPRHNTPSPPTQGLDCGLLAGSLREVARRLEVTHHLRIKLQRSLGKCRDLPESVKKMIREDAVNFADMGSYRTSELRDEMRDGKIVGYVMDEVCSRLEGEISYLKTTIKEALNLIDKSEGGAQ